MLHRITLVFGYLLLSFGSLYTQDRAEDWEYFPIIGDFVDAIETETDIWFAHRYHLLRWDKTRQELSQYLEGNTLWHISNAKDLFKYDGEYYLLSDRRLYQLQGENWEVIWGSSVNQPRLPREIIRAIGTYDSGLLFQFTNGFIYTIFPTEQDFDAELSPWNINWWENRTLQQTADGSMWAWSPNRLVRWQEEEMTEFALPVSGDSIIAAVPGQEQFQWVLSDQHLSYYSSQWINVPLAELSDQALTAHQALDETSIFLVFDDEVMSVRFTDDTYEITFRQDHLGHKRPGQQLYRASDGKLWYMDKLLRQLHYFTPDWDLQTVEEHNWVPSDAPGSTHVTKDRDGHIWACTPDQTVFYAGEQWHAGEEAYPGFPKAATQLQFTKDGTPIVFSQKRPSQNRPAYLQQYHQGQWGSYPLPDDGTGLSPADASRLLLDREDNIWLFLPSNTVVYTWDRYDWISISTTDLPSRPASFTSIAFDVDNNLLLSTPTGILKHDRQTSEFYTYSELGLAPSSFLNYLVVDEQNNHWYGGNELYKWGFDSTPESISGPWFWEGLNFFGFSGIYPFPNNETWVVNNGSSSSSRYLFGPNAEGEMVAAEAYFSPILAMFGNMVERDNSGRIWAVDELGVNRFTRPESTSIPGTSSDQGQLRAYPNPSCCHVQLSWENDGTPTQLQLYNAQGQLVEKLLEQEGHLGPQQFVIPRRGLAAGVYLAVLRRGTRTETVRIVFK